MYLKRACFSLADLIDRSPGGLIHDFISSTTFELDDGVRCQLDQIKALCEEGKSLRTDTDLCANRKDAQFVYRAPARTFARRSDLDSALGLQDRPPISLSCAGVGDRPSGKANENDGGRHPAKALQMC